MKINVWSDWFAAFASDWSLPATAGEAGRQLARFAGGLTPLEVSIMGLYGLIMAVLAFYGGHRLQLVWLYYRHAAKRPGAPKTRFAKMPRVTVQLPLYNERFVVEPLIESICGLDYPKDRLQIQVLDDSTDETAEIARSTVERMASLGYPIELRHRENRAGFKAGALAEGLETATGELIAVFDADFSPAPDFLLRTVDYFADPKVGAIQACWTYRNREQSLLTRLQAALLDGHFVFEQGGRNRSGRFFNFNGTAGILRRAMIDDAGGWECDTLTEDTDLSYRAQLRGWRFVYVQQIQAPSELPVEMAAFQVQQARWAKGLVQTGIKLLPTILRSGQPAAVKYEAIHHLTANLSYPLMALLAALVMPAAMIRFAHAEPWLLLIEAPLFAATFGSLAAFYLLARRELTGSLKVRDAALLPAVLAAGIGLTLSNSRAVLEALAGVETPFQRTAKFSGLRGAGRVRRAYATKLDGLPWINLTLGVYFAFSCGYLAWIGDWPMAPFLALFASGYLAAGVIPLYQTYGKRLSLPTGGTPALGNETT